MAAKIKIIVQGTHPIFDDEGHSMSASIVYSVSDTPLIQQYISEGFAVEVKNDEKSEPETLVELPKSLTRNTLKSQETDSTQPLGE